MSDFDPTALRPRLQTEFYEFLEQKLLNVESQLNASEKERNALGVALTQTEKKLEASNGRTQRTTDKCRRLDRGAIDQRRANIRSTREGTSAP